jgi:RsiW-degrading membrane proteinase PrsW (M82 family)
LPAAGLIAAGPVPSLPETSADRLRLDLLALGMALVGGLMALVGSFFQELQSGVGVFLVVLAAPVIEEVLKPSGIYVLLAKWPQALRGHLHTGLLCAISGAVFGVIESLIYVELYYPDGNDAFVLFRFTVTPVMHAIASFIVGYGLSKSLIDWANGKTSLPKRTRNGYLVGIALHATYNTSTVILGALGILDFLETVLLR